MPRLFTGIEIPADIAAELEMMRGGIPGARWIERESYHITLRFIGDIDLGLAREIATELDSVRATAFPVKFRGIGAFGGRRPHAIWAGVAESEPLRRLQGAQERICQRLGLEPEPRKYAPHVTLARLKEPPVESLHAWLAQHSLYQSRPFPVRRFVLFSSRPSRGGGPYAIEEAYPLQESELRAVV